MSKWTRGGGRTRRRVVPIGLLFLMAPWPISGQQRRAQPCIDCHLSQEDERLSGPALAFEIDVHGSLGLGCLSCHGKLATGRMSHQSGFLAKPARRQVPGLCGSCHSSATVMAEYNPTLPRDQEAEYWTSVHGQGLLADDPDVAICTDCHDPHEMRPPSDPESTVHPLNVGDLCASCHADRPLMEARGHEWDEFDEYRSGVHGRLLYDEGDVSAPTCNDCHGNHGAAPPGLSSIHAVCGQCHVTMDELFRENGHQEIFLANGLGACGACHENHATAVPTDEFLATTSRAVCHACHEEDEGVGSDFDRMGELLDSLERSAAAARTALAQAENLGMEVSQAQFDLEEVNNALSLARTAVHSFSAEAVRSEVAGGVATTDTAIARAQQAFHEHRIRRVGLAVSGGIIALLVLGLLLRIRGLDRERFEPDEER